MDKKNVFNKFISLILSIVWIALAIFLYQKYVENPPIPIISFLMGLGICSFIHLVLGGTNSSYFQYLRENIKITAFGATATVIILSILIGLGFHYSTKQNIVDLKEKEDTFIKKQNDYEKRIILLEENEKKLSEKIEYETSSKGRFDWIKSLEPESIDGNKLTEMVMNKERPFNEILETNDSVTASFMNIGTELSFYSCNYLKLKNKKININWTMPDGTQKSLNKPLKYTGSIHSNFCKENNKNNIDIQLSCDVGKDSFSYLVDNCTYKGVDVGWRNEIRPEDKKIQIGYEVLTDN